MSEREIVIAPFSNSELRDWPHFGELITLFVERTDAKVTVIGAASQRAAADRLVRAHPATRVINTAGVIPWSDVVACVKAAQLVVSNNSGVAHLSSDLGAPTICIFAASHSPYEWMARGEKTTVIIKETICSPCAIDVARNCPYGVRCLSEIGADLVFEACIDRMR